MRKPDFCPGKNKGADHLHSYCEADQHLCFRYTVQFLYFLNSKFPVSSHLLCLYSSLCVGPGRKPGRLVFSCRGSKYAQVREIRHKNRELLGKVNRKCEKQMPVYIQEVLDIQKYSQPKIIEPFRLIFVFSLQSLLYLKCSRKHSLSRRLMGKPTICIGENKDADQRLCFRY